MPAGNASVSEDNQEPFPESRIGNVAQLPADDSLGPLEYLPRFEGSTYLLADPKTCSQAIVFAAVFQDSELGIIAGQATGGWANQTGQVQMKALLHTGLFVAVPLFIIIRPSGCEIAAGVQPDWFFDADPAYGLQAMQQLLRKISSQQH